jgi:hypothetical protein
LMVVAPEMCRWLLRTVVERRKICCVDTIQLLVGRAIRNAEVTRI